MLLEIHDLKKSFGGVKAVQGVSLQVEPDQIVSIIGPNGAGKTTIFNLISGIYKPDSGQILFDGAEISQLPQHDIARLGIARTFQNIRLFKGLTVVENLMTSLDPVGKYDVFSAMIGLPNKRKRDRQNRERCMEYLRVVGLEDQHDTFPENLPYGLQRRVELARALVSNPKLLMLDEPAAGLNPSEVQGFIELLQTIKDTYHCGILVIEHRMQVVNTLSDYIYVVNFGELLAHGLPQDVRSNPDVIKAYIGEEE